MAEPRTIEFVRQSKEFIDRDYLEGLIEFVKEYHQDDTIAWDYILQKLYIHACLRKKLAISEKILEYIVLLDPIQQIAIRQMIPYGKWLLQRGGSSSNQQSQ